MEYLSSPVAITILIAAVIYIIVMMIINRNKKIDFRKDKGLVDIESACIILEQYLARRKEN